MNPHRVLHCYSPKGGSGKTTLALTLAGAAAARGLSVLVVDLDPNGCDGGALRWATQAQAFGRAPAFMVSPALPRHVDGFDLIITDHPPGRPTRLPDGLVIVPTSLDPGTYFSSRRALELLRKRRPAPILVANRVRLDRAEARQLLAQLPGTIAIRDRAIFSSAYGLGVTIADEGTGLSHAAAARAEFEPLVDRVLATLGVAGQRAA